MVFPVGSWVFPVRRHSPLSQALNLDGLDPKMLVQRTHKSSLFSLSDPALAKGGYFPCRSNTQAGTTNAGRGEFSKTLVQKGEGWVDLATPWRRDSSNYQPGTKDQRTLSFSLTFVIPYISFATCLGYFSAVGRVNSGGPLTWSPHAASGKFSPSAFLLSTRPSSHGNSPQSPSYSAPSLVSSFQLQDFPLVSNQGLPLRYTSCNSLRLAMGLPGTGLGRPTVPLSRSPCKERIMKIRLGAGNEEPDPSWLPVWRHTGEAEGIIQAAALWWRDKNKLSLSAEGESGHRKRGRKLERSDRFLTAS